MSHRPDKRSLSYLDLLAPIDIAHATCTSDEEGSGEVTIIDEASHVQSRATASVGMTPWCGKAKCTTGCALCAQYRAIDGNGVCYCYKCHTKDPAGMPRVSSHGAPTCCYAYALDVNYDLAAWVQHVELASPCGFLQARNSNLKPSPPVILTPMLAPLPPRARAWPRHPCCLPYAWQRPRSSRSHKGVWRMRVRRDSRHRQRRCVSSTASLCGIWRALTSGRPVQANRT